MFPRQSPATHTEQLGDEASVSDWTRAQVHALNPTAAHVWRQCDGATSPEAIAASLARHKIPEAAAIVELTLRQLARLHLLAAPVESPADRSAKNRRWLLGRGVAAAMLPTIYSIVAPSPLAAQSRQGTPTLTAISPAQGTQGATVAVTLTGTNFIVGATTVTVSGSGVTVNTVVVGSSTSLTANFALDVAAALGARTVTVTTAGGTSGAQTFTINLPAPGSQSVSFAGNSQTFTVPAGVVSILIEAVGARGVAGFPSGNAGNGGRAVARVSVAPRTVLTVRVGGPGGPGLSGSTAAGGFNGGGGTTGNGGGGGGGATSVHDGATPLVIAGGGGSGVGSAGGGATKEPAGGSAGVTARPLSSGAARAAEAAS